MGQHRISLPVAGGYRDRCNAACCRSPIRTTYPRIPRSNIMRNIFGSCIEVIIKTFAPVQYAGYAALNRPAKPMNAMESMPAMMRLRAVLRIRRGTSANSDSSRIPAIRTSARVKPRPAPSA